MEPLENRWIYAYIATYLLAICAYIAVVHSHVRLRTLNCEELSVVQLQFHI
jgi:hypothetical protein